MFFCKEGGNLFSRENEDTSTLTVSVSDTGDIVEVFSDLWTDLMTGKRGEITNREVKNFDTRTGVPEDFSPTVTHNTWFIFTTGGDKPQVSTVRRTCRLFVNPYLPTEGKFQSGESFSPRNEEPVESPDPSFFSRSRSTGDVQGKEWRRS